MKAWTYNITSAPANLAVSLADFKTHLRITGSTQDAELTAILKSAILYGEQTTKRDFITRTYQTFRDELNQVEEIRRSKLQSVTSITYLVDGSPVAVDSDIYYNTLDTDFSSILLDDGESWPTGGDVRAQSVEVVFLSGYGDDATDIPDDIKTAIMAHATNYYENRGDCSVPESLPAISAGIYAFNRIKDFVL